MFNDNSWEKITRKVKLPVEIGNKIQINLHGQELVGTISHYDYAIGGKTTTASSFYFHENPDLALPVRFLENCIVLEDNNALRD